MVAMEVKLGIIYSCYNSCQSATLNHVKSKYTVIKFQCISTKISIMEFTQYFMYNQEPMQQYI